MALVYTGLPTCIEICLSPSVCDNHLTSGQHATFKTLTPITYGTYGIRTGACSICVEVDIRIVISENARCEMPKKWYVCGTNGRKETGQAKTSIVEQATWIHHGRTNTSFIYGNHEAYSILPCVDTMLERGYECANFCAYGSSTSATPWDACKNSSVQHFPDVEPPTISVKMSSSKQSIACWLATSDLLRWVSLQCRH